MVHLAHLAVIDFAALTVLVQYEVVGHGAMFLKATLHHLIREVHSAKGQILDETVSNTSIVVLDCRSVGVFNALHDITVCIHRLRQSSANLRLARLLRPWIS